MRTRKFLCLLGWGILICGPALGGRSIQFLVQGGDFGGNNVHSWCTAIVKNISSQNQTVQVQMDFHQIGFTFQPVREAQLKGTSCGAATISGNNVDATLTPTCNRLFIKFTFNSAGNGGPGTRGSPSCEGTIEVTENRGAVVGHATLFASTPTASGSSHTTTPLAINRGAPF